MPLPQVPIVMEFRDGERSLPAHVASDITLAEIDTAFYTYEEAVRLSRDALMKRFLNNFASDMVFKHFRDNR